MLRISSSITVSDVIAVGVSHVAGEHFAKFIMMKTERTHLRGMTDKFRLVLSTLVNFCLPSIKGEEYLEQLKYISFSRTVFHGTNSL
jgi:hypothetical protein